MSTIEQAVREATAKLSGSDSADLDARLLLCETLDCNTAHLAAWPEKKLEPNQLERFAQLVERRRQGEPVAYIRGHQEFFSRRFDVDARTLIPRPETECMIEFVLDNFDASAELDVIDLGTGSGAIAVTLACERPRWNITATDISAGAVEVASRNAASHHAAVDFVLSDWFDDIDACFDLVISNPPYVAEQDPHLEALRYEPLNALASGPDGLDDIRRLSLQALQRIRPSGWLIVEHGYDQAQGVADCLLEAGFDRLQQHRDHAGQPRFTAARRPEGDADQRD